MSFKPETEDTESWDHGAEGRGEPGNAEEIWRKNKLD